MATDGKVPGQNSGRAGPEDQDQLKCQPCLEDGHLHEAVGMCVDCDDYLCEKCYQGHKIPKPTRKHKLLDLEEMRQGQISASSKDVCTETCPDHEDEIKQYYCSKHRRIGCTVCVTLNHKTCHGVHYIPNVAKELATNKEYMQAEKQLKLALDTFNTVSENVTQTSEKLETSCAEAVKSIREFRRRVDEALSKLENELIEKIEAVESEENKELATIRDKYRVAHEELQEAWTKIKSLLNSQQHCDAYINMMQTQDKLAALEPLIDQALWDASYKTRTLEFTPNRNTLETLKSPDTLGTVPGSSGNLIERLTHTRDLNVSARDDKNVCVTTGLAIFPGERLILTDYTNIKLKTVNAQSGHVLSHLKLPSYPWDVTAISSSKVAVTLPHKKKVAIITVGDTAMSMDRYISVDGKCHGVDYGNDKLAVSFAASNKVQVINMQGFVLHTISTEMLGKPLFNEPYYLTYGQDDTTLYVSNYSGNDVVCIKMDGAVVTRYKGNGLNKGLHQLAVDNNGDVLVCVGDSSPYIVHQMTGSGQTSRTLLTKADGLGNPQSLCFSVQKDMLFVGMDNSNIVKVYTVERESR